MQISSSENNMCWNYKSKIVMKICTVFCFVQILDVANIERIYIDFVSLSHTLNILLNWKKIVIYMAHWNKKLKFQLT